MWTRTIMQEVSGAKEFLQTGYEQLDDALGGLRPGQLVVVSGSAGMGKTSFVLSLAHRMCMMGQHVSYVTFETDYDNTMRHLFKISNGKTMDELRQTPDDELDFSFPAERFHCDTLCPTLEVLHHVCRRNLLEHGVRLMIFDSLQHMRIDDIFGKRQGERDLHFLVFELKRMAQEYQVPIILCSNRGYDVMRDPDESPEYPYWYQDGDDLACNEAADVFLHLVRPEYYQVYLDMKCQDQRGLMDVHIMKNRNGATDKISMKFNRFVGMLVDDKTGCN